MVQPQKDLDLETDLPAKEDSLQDSDCCGNGCTNCILDNKPQPSKRVLLAGKRNVILNYTKFRLLRRENLESDGQVLLLHFGHAPEEGTEAEDCVLDIPPGHHVMLRFGSLLRPYSPYWSDFLAKEFRILVKLQKEGPMSQHLAAVQPNDLLEFRGPIGQYVHDPQNGKCIYIVAQGVAIAPTLPLVRQVLDDEEDMSRLWHLVCAPDLQHVYFREELLEFAQFWNYKGCLYLPHQKCDSADCKKAKKCNTECLHFRRSLRYREMAKVCRLDASELSRHVNTSIPGQRIVIVAGDSSFQRNISQLATESLAVDPANVYLL
ncbi:NADH-cytochrome b5 reductase-like [Drosophila ficusphila]|uniref:NADH-cytochrome b5 reductase-like n=1 Tax=Drosophila ficusphila TaxID=30025 RepID=UPI0007E78084|nr:NADH-cytochrome b5 reductase-like [Drosophila ficusphila]XP_017050627.1 NADH-cytochrome b5 reductase-like [Drosophila ficusphila]